MKNKKCYICGLIKKVNNNVCERCDEIINSNLECSSEKVQKALNDCEIRMDKLKRLKKFKTIRDKIVKNYKPLNNFDVYHNFSEIIEIKETCGELSVTGYLTEYQYKNEQGSVFVPLWTFDVTDKQIEKKLIEEFDIKQRVFNEKSEKVYKYLISDQIDRLKKNTENFDFYDNFDKKEDADEFKRLLNLIKD